MLPQRDPGRTLMIVCIAATLIIAIKLALWHFDKPVAPPPPAPVYVPVEGEIVEPVLPDVAEDITEDFTALPQPAPVPNEIAVAAPKIPKESPVFAPVGPGETLRIAIIIDDMGMDRRRSREIMELPAPLTLSFLPYAEGLPEMTALAAQTGHELMIHAPMEPMDPDLDVGAIALMEGMSAQELEDSLDKMFTAFPGYAGMNNHMGSRLTQARPTMEIVMDALAARGLYFVDSKTINTSVAAEVAAERGLKFGERDVFLDHVDSREAALHALAEAEHIARKKGYAVVIGHPKDSTIAALKEWLPGAKARGVEIVKMSALVR